MQEGLQLKKGQGILQLSDVRDFGAVKSDMLK